MTSLGSVSVNTTYKEWQREHISSQQEGLARAHWPAHCDPRAHSSKGEHLSKPMGDQACVSFRRSASGRKEIQRWAQDPLPANHLFCHAQGLAASTVLAMAPGWAPYLTVSSGILFLFFFFYLSIADLQCCANFCCTAK